LLKVAINSDHLLDQAERLAAPPSSGRPRQADLRRAISTAYYALFHAALTAAADYVIGAGKSATEQYALAYRSINHGPLRNLCHSACNNPNSYKIHFPHGLGEELAAFAIAIVELQEKRHRADYDPRYAVTSTEAAFAVRQARAALASFGSAPEEQRKALLALLLFPPRKGAS
jgi:hypothetical protein